MTANQIFIASAAALIIIVVFVGLLYTASIFAMDRYLKKKIRFFRLFDREDQEREN